MPFWRILKIRVVVVTSKQEANLHLARTSEINALGFEINGQISRLKESKESNGKHINSAN